MLRVDGIVPDHAVQIPEPVGEPGAEFAVLLGMDIAVDSPAVHVGLRRRPVHHQSRSPRLSEEGDGKEYGQTERQPPSHFTSHS